ncbi:cyclase family protein [Paracoccus pantotrophus]|uniref:cyclase family protein n=1 Tax=Paracoccus pantotrophus TaxID=82367 RepID=UPI0009DCC17C|nr:cyclase family protein [Paracoccus pantotrophus]
MTRIYGIGLAAICAMLSSGAQAQDAGLQKWVKGTGWGWVWGPDDQVGALNEMTKETRKAALASVADGKVYDLGVRVDRNSYYWKGHSPNEVMNFRTPRGILTQDDYDWMQPEAGNTSLTTWRSAALFVSDSAGTQLDGLAHVQVGEDSHFYNGFKSTDWEGDFGIRKADITNTPPIVARAVLIDVAGFKEVPALESGYEITVEDLQGALAAQGTDIEPGSVVLIRTGALSTWNGTGADHEALEKHTLAGIGLPAARWLVEQKGAMLIGADNEGLEVYPPKEPGSTDPVHVYLLVEQGVQIMEFVHLEELAADRTYGFAFILTTNALRGAASGTILRPIAIR